MKPILLVSGLVILMIGLVFQFVPLSSLSLGPGTVNSINPASSLQSSPTAWNPGQGQYLSAFVTQPATSQNVVVYYSLQCQTNCGTAPQVALNIQAVAPSVTTLTTSPGVVVTPGIWTSTGGWFNYTWPASAEGAYPIGATFTAAWGSVSSTGNSINFYARIGPAIVGDFSISASPTSLTMAAGASPIVETITIVPINSLTASVSLAVTPCTSGLFCSGITPATITSASGTASFAIGGNTVGSYTVTVTGVTQGVLPVQTHSIQIAVTVTTSGSTPDFSLAVSAQSSPVIATTSGTSMVTVTPLNGFTGTVSLSLSATGLNGFPASVVIQANTGATTVSVAYSASQGGIYQTTVTGISGSLTHSVVTTLVISDFSLIPSTTILTLTSSSSIPKNINITASSLFGFSGTVSLTVAVSPSPGLAFTPPAATTLSPQIPITIVTLTPSVTVSGTYQIVITGAVGSLTHSLTLFAVPGPAPVQCFLNICSLPVFSPISLVLTSAGGILSVAGLVVPNRRKS